MLQEFRKFATKGNVVDLAVAVIIGTAFGKIVASLVGDMIMPLVGVLLGGVDFKALAVTVGSASVQYGKFIQASVDFLVIALVIFFMVKALSRPKREEAKPAAPAAPPRQEVLLEEIRDLLKAR